MGPQEHRAEAEGTPLQEEVHQGVDPQMTQDQGEEVHQAVADPQLSQQDQPPAEFPICTKSI